MIPDELKAECGVTFVCKNCNKQTTVPALRVEPGILCPHCGKELEVTAYALALKKNTSGFRRKKGRCESGLITHRREPSF